MATANPFALLGDDDNDDPSQLIAAQQQKVATLPAKKPAVAGAAAAALPSKPAPPAQAVRDGRSSTAPVRGGGRGGVGRGRGDHGSGHDQSREHGNGNLNGSSGGYGRAGVGGEDGDGGRPVDRERGSYGGPRQPYRGGRRGGYGNEEAGAGGDYERPPRRMFERRSGTGRGSEIKREGSGRGNWGTPSDDVLTQEAEEVVNVEERPLRTEKQPEEDAPASEANKEKEGAASGNEEKEEEDKEMTLEEYEKIREEKRKALLSTKAEERKVDLDKEFLSMQQLSLKKGNDDVFVKLGSDKDSKRKDNIDRDERVKKSVSINEFLKPAEGGYYTPGGRGRGPGRGRGRGRGDFGGQSRGSFSGDYIIAAPAPVIDDPGHFPTLGGKK